jgi:hypothetical protein
MLAISGSGVGGGVYMLDWYPLSSSSKSMLTSYTSDISEIQRHERHRTDYLKGTFEELASHFLEALDGFSDHTGRILNGSIHGTIPGSGIDHL